MDRLGRVYGDVMWGGRYQYPNVEAKGANAKALLSVLRGHPLPHMPSHIDVMRQASSPGLYEALRALALRFKAEGLVSKVTEYRNNDPDKGDTFYLGSLKSQTSIRVYQKGLQLAEREGRTGDQISDDERNAVRAELVFKPEKHKAKKAAASLSLDAMWSVSDMSCAFAREVFAMNVQPISLRERRESNRDRALRFMSSQYSSHLESLWQECGGDYAMFATTILDLAGVPHGH